MLDLPQDNELSALKERLRLHLIGLARAKRLTTYKELTRYLDLSPPQTIHQVTSLLELLIAEDANAGRPLLAAICVSRLRGDLPAPGFFLTIASLGLSDSTAEGLQAQEFHQRELGRLFSFYRD